LEEYLKPYLQQQFNNQWPSTVKSSGYTGDDMESLFVEDMP
jgi:hypothetical protein